MSRAGITGGLAGLIGVALAVAPVSPGQATRSPSGHVDRIVAAGTPQQSPARAHQPNPSVTKMAPQTGPTTGGLDVVIKGRNLTGVKRVLFGATKAANVRVKSARKLVVRAPAHEAGLVRVRVVTKHGGSKQSEATHFTYVTPAPALSRLSPRTGPTAGGTTVTITGRDLSGATSVRFGSTSATSFHVTSPTTITATSPGRPVGPVNITVTTAGGSATLDDGYSYVAAPRLSFVDPGSGPLVATPVTLVGTALTADAHVTFGGAPAVVLSASSDGTELTVNTPGHAAGFADVIVTTAGGSSTLTRGYLFVAGTTLTAVTPSAGPSSGGVTVTLTGTGFTGETLVTFGNKPSIEVLANLEGTELTALLPSHAAGPVDVTVATVGGSATLASGLTYVDAPTLATVAPTTGPTGGGTPVTLAGTQFRAGMQVRFGGVLATGVTMVSTTQATALTPAHAAGDVDVSVTTPGGTTTLSNAFTYVAAPSLTDVSPDEGPATGGQSVTLSGTNLRSGMQVRFDGTLATLVSVHASGTLAMVTTPVHAAGAVDVSVTTPGGSDALAGGYTYQVAPTLIALSPDVGPIGGGTTVTLTGSGFRADMQVRFGGALAALDSVNPGGTSATVTTPAHAAVVVNVSVTTPGGTATRADSFTYVATPSLTDVSPNEGSTTGGLSVTLTGTNLRSGMDVRFGGVLATLESVNPAGTSATATTPAHAAGVVDVSVTTQGGSATLHGGYTYVTAPTLTAVSPDEGPAAGGQSVTVTGTGFRAGMQVSFGGVAATDLVVTSATQATVTTPPHPAGDVDVSVTTPGGSDTLVAGFTYVAAPTLSAVTPDTGPAAGGTTVTLIGTGFRAGIQVELGGQPATDVVVVSATELTATTPAHAADFVDVEVTTSGGSATLGFGFEYVASPTLSTASPPAGPLAGGTSVTLFGSDIAGATSVTFGGVPATNLTPVSPAILVVSTPAHSVGAVDVVVTTPGGSATLSDGYTYVAPPEV